MHAAYDNLSRAPSDSPGRVGYRPALMVRILDYNGRDAERTVTVASIGALKGSGRQFTQVTAGNAEEAAAAEAAGIEMIKQRQAALRKALLILLDDRC